MELKGTKGVRYNLNYHLLCPPKYNRAILTGLIADRLAELFAEIADKWGFKIIAQELMPDHIHLFVSVSPKYSPSKIAPLFKGTTSRIIRLSC